MGARPLRPLASLALPLLGVLLLAGACAPSTEPGVDTAPTVESVASEIRNGEPDTTRDAVVAVILQEGQQGGVCTGTFVKTDPASGIGWVVTAAHCVDIPPVLVVLGADFSRPDALHYDIVDFKVDDRYTGEVASSYDFAVLRVIGVDATTPTLPLVTSPDGLAVGTQVVSVGYGRTTLIASGASDQNTTRRRVAKALGQVTATKVSYSMTSSGICQGDSGGPVLVTTAAGEAVAAVHSYVQGDCNGTGVSGRVQAGLSFFQAELDKPLPPRDCALCTKGASAGNGICATLTRSCLADAECGGFYRCLSRGSTRAACLEQFPKAEGPFNAAANCACTRACASECEGSLDCLNVPRCGYRLPAGDCATCTEGACCSEALDCAADGTCYVCLKSKDADPACASNVARKALAACVATSCKVECAGSELETEEEPAGPASVPDDETEEGGAVQRVTTTSCAQSAGGPSGSSPLLALGLALSFALGRRARSFTRARRTAASAR